MSVGWKTPERTAEAEMFADQLDELEKKNPDCIRLLRGLMKSHMNLGWKVMCRILVYERSVEEAFKD